MFKIVCLEIPGVYFDFNQRFYKSTFAGTAEMQK
jgi:hypothetical protein